MIQLCSPLSLACKQTLRPHLHATSIWLSMRKTRPSYPRLARRTCRLSQQPRTVDTGLN